MKRSHQPRTIPDGFVPGQTVSRDAGMDVRARFQPSTWNTETRTLEAVLTVGAPVTRWGITEVLAISPGAVDVSRVPAGQVRLLDSHSQASVDDVLGLVESVRFEGASLVGVIRLADNDRGRAVAERVASGDLTGISIGYAVRSWTLTATDPQTGGETWTATNWELLEVSLVAVPADPAARVRNAGAESPVSTQLRAPAHNQGDDDMRRNLASTAETEAARTQQPQTPVAPATETRAAPPVAPTVPANSADVQAAVRAETARVTEIQSLGRRAGLVGENGADHEVVARAVSEGLSVDAFRSRAFDALAARASDHRTQATVTRDEGDTRRGEFGDAVYYGIRSGVLSSADREAVGRLSENSRRMMTYTISELAAAYLGQRHLPRTVAEHEEVLRRGFMTTSDFPVLLANGLNRVLSAQYQAAAPTYRQIAAPMTFTDFRAHEVLRVGDFPMLTKVLESGEIKVGTFGEKKESLTLLSYATQVRFSRQLLINDRLGGINQMLAGYGTTVSLFEEITFYAMLQSGSGSNGPTLVETGGQVFASGNGNLKSSDTGAIDVTKVSTGRTALRKMKRLDGNAMNLAPSIILAGPDRETEIDQLLSPINPVARSEVNVFSGRLTPVISSQIGALPWYLFVDPSVLATFQYGLLDGFSGPRMRIDEPFGIQGVAVSLEHDFGCGAVDFRGGWRNTGA